ncbi:MAG: tetratricopeptide repeat protein [Nitrospirae bacterium]|nr:tetratricopeptide repeat protein [Candidatus Manganitrophaceae bacterium]
MKRLTAEGLSLILLLVVFSSCSMGEAKKEKHYKRGVDYVAHEKYSEAAVEFKNVLQIDPQHTDAKYQLGLVYLKLGGLVNARNAFKLLSEVVQKKPDLVEAQVRLATLYLASGDLKSAKEKAELVLQKKQGNPDALLVLARIAQREGRLDEAAQTYQKILDLDPKRLQTYYEFAGLYLLKKDSASAESLLQKALLLDPQSVESHINLARFYHYNHQPKEAESFYLKAISISPKSKSLYFALANFYMLEKRTEEAENRLIEATGLDSKDPDPFIALGDFYLNFHKAEGAEKAYRQAKEARPDGMLSRKKLGDLYLTQGKKNEASGIIDEILSKNGSDPEGLLLKGRLLLAENKSGEAVIQLRKAIEIEPMLYSGHYYLALAHMADHDLQQAKSQFSEAIKQNSKDMRSRLALAELLLQSRSFDPAISEAERIIESDPSVVKAYLILGDAAVSRGDVKKGEGAYQKFLTLAPKEPIGYYRLGLIRRAQKKEQEALTFFEKALSINVNYPDALSQIVAIHLSKGEGDKALKRVTAQIDASPRNPVFYNLLAKLYASKKDYKRAEESHRKAIDLDPTYLASYLDLGSLYAQAKQFDQGLQKLDEALKVNPNVAQIYMTRGVIYETQQKYSQAQKEYEKALQIDPNFAPAANNLAWIYAEQGGNIDRALTLAQMAKEKYPEDPAVSDTLGWIYYKKNVFIKAVSLLEDSVEKLSQNPVVRYHLGMAYYKNGQKALARKELAESLKLGKTFVGSDEAEKVLKEL